MHLLQSKPEVNALLLNLIHVHLYTRPNSTQFVRLYIDQQITYLKWAFFVRSSNVVEIGIIVVLFAVRTSLNFRILVSSQIVRYCLVISSFARTNEIRMNSEYVIHPNPLIGRNTYSDFLRISYVVAYELITKPRRTACELNEIWKFHDVRSAYHITMIPISRTYDLRTKNANYAYVIH